MVRESSLLSTLIHNYADVFSSQFWLTSAKMPSEKGGPSMPKDSPYRIVLTSDEQVRLEARSRKYTSPYRDVIRAKIVLLAAQGLANDVIAARLDTPRQIVSKWRKRFALERLPGLEEQPRGGRPARFSPSLVVQVKALACELPQRLGMPLSHLAIADIKREVIGQGWWPILAGLRSGVG